MPAPICPFEFALEAWPAIWAGDLLRYLVPASLVTMVLALLPAAWRSRRSVRERRPAVGQRRRELLHSLITVLVFSVNGALIAAGVQAGVLVVYTGWNERGTFYAVVSLVLLIVLHDAWFYWTHRLLHHPRLFRWMHLTHHRSVAPTPWAAYSFSVGEAAVQAVFLTLVLLALPLHPLVIFMFLIHMIVRNVLGHAGVELVPGTWLAGAWGRWLTTTLHHDMHHASGSHNYGLYFTWWDRYCGTEHPDYRQRLARLIEQLQNAAPGNTCPSPSRHPNRTFSRVSSNASTPGGRARTPSAAERRSPPCSSLESAGVGTSGATMAASATGAGAGVEAATPACDGSRLSQCSRRQ